MRVLLVGSGEAHHIGAFFQKALTALGHEQALVDEGKYLKRLSASIVHRIAYRLLRHRLFTFEAFNQEVVETARRFRPDVVLVTKGASLVPATLSRVKEGTRALWVNYATDDPFNPRHRTPDLLASIPLYDLYACTKRAIMDDVRRAGCAQVVYVPFAYEPTLHFPEQPATENEKARFDTDVVFVGTADPERYPLFRTLAAQPHLRLRLYGTYWERDRVLRRYHEGIVFARTYRLALAGAKIALCLLRRANRDHQTLRSFEIPACGAFMLAERTEEHLALFAEEREAVYFDSTEELLEKVTYYLARESQRRRIAEAGHRRVVQGRHTYQDRLVEIFRHVEALR